MAWRLHDDISVSIAYQGSSEEAVTSKVYAILEQKVADLQDDEECFNHFEEGWFTQFRDIYIKHAYHGNVLTYGGLRILPMSAIKELATLPKDQSGLGEFFRKLYKVAKPHFNKSDFRKILLIFEFID